MSTIRQEVYRLLITLFAKLVRALILAIIRLILDTKPTPDSTEYITATTAPATTTTTLSNPPKNASHKIKVHIYSPPAISSPAQLPPSQPPPSPALITLPGTGFITPCLGLDSPYCTYIAASTSYTVIDVAYRVAPEHPFPCALEDLVVVVDWVRSQPDRFDLNQLWLGGFSAGGNIAISMAVTYLGKGAVRGVVGIYPIVDGDFSISRGGSDKTQREELVKLRGRPKHGGLGSVPGFLMRFFRACYLVDTPFGRSTGSEFGTESASGEDILRDPRVSPVYADIDWFPARCLFVTAEHDSLSTGVEKLVERIKSDSADRLEEARRVILHRVSGCGHAFNKGVKKESERERIQDKAYGVIAQFLREG
ncbi:Alpha/Beta hydrolase protein [Aspergillus crustosus]